jgi:hypothetical protein
MLTGCALLRVEHKNDPAYIARVAADEERRKARNNDPANREAHLQRKREESRRFRENQKKREDADPSLKEARLAREKARREVRAAQKRSGM